MHHTGIKFCESPGGGLTHGHGSFDSFSTATCATASSTSQKSKTAPHEVHRLFMFIFRMFYMSLQHHPLNMCTLDSLYPYTPLALLCNTQDDA